MRPVTANAEQIAYWANADDIQVERQVVIGGPEEAPDVIPCPALITSSNAENAGGMVVRVAFELDEIEVAALAQGGTLWLSTWGGLPIHMLEVQAPTPRGDACPLDIEAPPHPGSNARARSVLPVGDTEQKENRDA